MRAKHCVGVGFFCAIVSFILIGCSQKDPTSADVPPPSTGAARAALAYGRKQTPEPNSTRTAGKVSANAQDADEALKNEDAARVATTGATRSMAPATPLAGGGYPSLSQQSAAHIHTLSGRFAASSLPAAPRATYNPNMYLSNTYLGGNGEKDRLEKLINEGVMVDGRRVKLEAFTRSYAQAFPIPTRTALNLVADTERTKIVEQGGHTYLQVGLQAIKGEAPRRPLLNIALVIDRSGSMGDEKKLEYAKQAAMELVDKLHRDDLFALVVFDDRVDVLVPSQQVRDRARIKDRIAALSPGGGTNIYSGLEMGYREARKHATPDSVNRVILLSDGEVTAGVNDPQQFYRMASANVDRDIQTTSVGLGIEFNEDLMLSIAREGKGNYHFIKDGTGTHTVFARELDELTHIVAKAVKLRIRLAEGVGFVRALGAATLNAAQTQQVKADEKKIDRRVYEELGISANRQHAKDEAGIKMLIPDFYRGDSHVVMLEVSVPPGRGAHPIAEVSLKYKDLVEKANRETKVSVGVQYTPSRDEMIASINRNVKKNLLGFQTGEALSEAATLIGQGRVADAVRRVDERMVVLGVAAKEWHDRDLDQDGRLLDRYKVVLADLQKHPQLAQSDYGQYLTRSLTYTGYTMTR
jgi:Mg-chelatase subunit ChlD